MSDLLDEAHEFLLCMDKMEYADALFALRAELTEARRQLAAQPTVPEAVALLSELFAQVQGECPSLLDGDRGGDNSLCLRIASILSATDSEGRSNGLPNR